jgi:hypothetical protein
MPGGYVIRRAGVSTNEPGGQVPSTIGVVDARRRNHSRLQTTMPPDAERSPGATQPISQRGFHEMSLRSADRTLGPVDVALRLAIVALALSTGYIHSTLGGPLFTLNALGYLTAAVAMVIPLGIAVRFRWFVRLGLIGYAATTIIAWAVQGPYFMTAYIAKAIEVALIAFVAIDFARMDGNPITVVKSELALLSARLGRRSATGSAGA